MGAEHLLVACGTCPGGGVITDNVGNSTCPECNGRGVISIYGIADDRVVSLLRDRGLSTAGTAEDRLSRLRLAVDR